MCLHLGYEETLQLFNSLAVLNKNTRIQGVVIYIIINNKNITDRILWVPIGVSKPSKNTLPNNPELKGS